MIDYAFLLKTVRDSCSKGFSIVGVVYSLLKIIHEILPSVSLAPDINLSLLLLVFFVAFFSSFVLEVWTFYFQEVTITHTDKSIGIRFGDILKKTDGSILVGINNTLEYNIEKIGKDSIQYQLSKKYGSSWMMQLFESEKEKNKDIQNTDHIYPYGYTFDGVSPDRKQHFVFLVMSGLESNRVPGTMPSYLTSAIVKLFSTNDFRCINNRLYVPALGTGRVALPLSKQNAAKNIVHIFTRNTSAESTSVHDLRIIFRWHSYKKIDMVSLYKDIGSYARVCCKCPSKI